MLTQVTSMGPLELSLAVVDIAIVAYVLYRLLALIRGTRAVQLLKGVLLLVVATPVSGWLRLYTIHWLLQKFQLWLIFAMLIVFQPELRRILEQLGRGRFFTPPPAYLDEEEMAQLVRRLALASEVLSRNKTGAIIVLERETGLKEVIETGTRIDGVVSPEFVVNIFVPATPLHDGAVVIRGNRVAAASCFLPLSDSADLSRDLGTRHRAALGITEQSDAVAIVVSEETGTVSVATGGRLVRHLDARSLEETLGSLLKIKPVSGFVVDERAAAPGGN
ncbi:MAG: diadenylate cyclase CdaA [bacterium]|nr:diadenylate cyclase CdaA [bacterium]